MRRRAMAMALLLVATAAACGGDDGVDDSGATSTASAAAAGTTAAGDVATTTAGAATTTAGEGSAGPARVQPDEEAAACVEGKTLEPLALTVATGDPAFPPYVIDDDPTSGQGFESAVVYAVAGTMGIGPAAVTWVRTPFEAAIAPGPKDYDFNIQQFGITPAREQVVTFSQAYYTGNQAILGYADSPAVAATTLSDYQDLVIGVAAGTTSLDFVTGVIQPTADPLVFNDNAAAKAALDAKQIDAIVADLPTAIDMATEEIEGAEVFGQFPPADAAEGESWGMLFAKDSPLVECVNLALAALRDSGQLEDITRQWMTTGTPIPDINLD